MSALGRTWIVVLDDARARFLRRELSGNLAEAAPAAAAQPGNVLRPFARRKAREDFLRQVVNVVNDACDRGGCDRILVIAPDRLLRTFRKLATDRILSRLWRERAIETTTLSDTEIAAMAESYPG